MENLFYPSREAVIIHAQTITMHCLCDSVKNIRRLLENQGKKHGHTSMMRRMPAAAVCQRLFDRSRWRICQAGTGGTL